MKTSPNSSFSSLSMDGRCDAAVLRRLGNELAHAYEDTLQSSLPERLQHLVMQLERSSAQAAGQSAAERA